MRHRDFIQNITITLLTLSAVFLFSRTQFFQLGAAAGSGYWQHLTAPIGSGETDTALSDRLLAPVRLAVSGEYGRYGSVSLTTGGEEFTPVKTLLREVIGSARSLSDSSWAVFRAALETPSVYCDFLSALPVEYLSDLMGAETDLSLTVRGLAAAEQGEQVILLLWDGGSRYYQCATAVQRSALQEVLEQFDFGVSTFAFEEEAGQHLAPLSLFPDPLPELPQLTAGDAAVSTETLLTALGFNPHIYMTFACPLSLGQESQCECVDVKTEAENPDFAQWKTALNAIMPAGIEVYRVEPVKMKADAIAYACYRIRYPADAAEKLAQYNTLDSVPVEKKSKRGVRMVEMKEYVPTLELETEGESVSFAVCLPASQDLNLNPSLLTAALEAKFGVPAANASILRTEFLTADKRKFE